MLAQHLLNQQPSGVSWVLPIRNLWRRSSAATAFGLIIVVLFGSVCPLTRITMVRFRFQDRDQGVFQHRGHSLVLVRDGLVPVLHLTPKRRRRDPRSRVVEEL